MGEAATAEQQVLPSGRILFSRKGTWHLLPQQDKWLQYPQGASWGGWRIPYGWEPAVCDQQMYFINHLDARTEAVLPQVAERDKESQDHAGRELRLVTLFVQHGQPLGFTHAPDNPRLVTAVSPGSAASAGALGLRVDDEIIMVGGVDVRKLSAAAIPALLRQHRSILVLTVLSMQQKRELNVLYEDGRKQVFSVSETETVGRILARALEQRGFRHPELFRLRLPTGQEGLQWLGNEQPISAAFASSSEPATCHLSIRFIPSDIETLSESDINVFTYLYVQTTHWISQSFVDIDDESAVELAAILLQRFLLQRMQSKGSTRGSRKMDLSFVEREIGLAELFPATLRERVNDEKRDFRRRLQACVRRYSVTEYSTEQSLMLAYLEMAVAAEGLGTSTYKLLLGGRRQTVVTNNSGIHLVVDAGEDREYRALGIIPQLASLQVDLGPDSDMATATVCIHQRMVSTPKSWMFTGDRASIIDFCRCLSAIYTVVVDNRTTLFENNIDCTTGAKSTSIRPIYSGRHTAVGVGWNYSGLDGVLHELVLPFDMTNEYQSDIIETKEAPLPANEYQFDANKTEEAPLPANEYQFDANKTEEAPLPANEYQFDANKTEEAPLPSIPVPVPQDVERTEACAISDASENHKLDVEEMTIEALLPPPDVWAPESPDFVAPPPPSVDLYCISSTAPTAEAHTPTTFDLGFEVPPPPEIVPERSYHESTESDLPWKGETQVFAPTKIETREEEGEDVSNADADEELGRAVAYMKEALTEIVAQSKPGAKPRVLLRENSDADEELTERLIEMWNSMKALVGSLWQFTDAVAMGDIETQSTASMKLQAADAAALMGVVLEHAAQLPDAIQPDGTAASTCKNFQMLAVRFLQVLQLLKMVQSTPNNKPLDESLIYERVAPFLQAGSTVMRLLASHGRYSNATD